MPEPQPEFPRLRRRHDGLDVVREHRGVIVTLCWGILTLEDEWCNLRAKAYTLPDHPVGPAWFDRDIPGLLLEYGECCKHVDAIHELTRGSKRGNDELDADGRRHGEREFEERWRKWGSQDLGGIVHSPAKKANTSGGTEG